MTERAVWSASASVHPSDSESGRDRVEPAGERAGRCGAQLSAAWTDSVGDRFDRAAVAPIAREAGGEQVDPPFDDDGGGRVGGEEPAEQFSMSEPTPSTTAAANSAFPSGKWW